MSKPFLTSKESRERIAVLEKQIAALGSEPINCSDPKGENFVAAADIEKALAECKARKTSAGHRQPVIACHAEATGKLPAKDFDPDISRRLQALDAGVARLEAIKLQRKATEAKKAAQALAKAPASKTPHLDVFQSLPRADAHAYYLKHRRAINEESRNKSTR